MKSEHPGRYQLIDTIRGFTIINMILFHACWDLIYMFGHKFRLYDSWPGYIWQQCICWSFILLSGFCFYFSRRHLRRGIVVSLAGVLISVVTCIFMPKGSGILFGILTFLGCAMLITTPLDKLFKKLNPLPCLIISFALFFVLKDINIGCLGFEKLYIYPLPKSLYKGYFMSFLGFMDPDFYSTDYFSLFPWYFLFLTGYFICPLIKSKDKVLKPGIGFLSFLGRHSLLIYLAHQPIVYAILYLWHLVM